MKLGNFTGIRGIPNQDIAMWETMGPIADRSRERLGASDLAIVEFRRDDGRRRAAVSRRRPGDRHRRRAIAPPCAPSRRSCRRAPTGARSANAAPGNPGPRARTCTTSDREPDSMSKLCAVARLLELRPHARADGRRVQPDGIDLTYLNLPVEETFFRMLRHREFDVAEMSLSSYTVSMFREPRPFVAIPIFPSRFFRHSSHLRQRRHAGIREPRT